MECAHGRWSWGGPNLAAGAAPWRAAALSVGAVQCVCHWQQGAAHCVRAWAAGVASLPWLQVQRVCAAGCCSACFYCYCYWYWSAGTGRSGGVMLAPDAAPWQVLRVAARERQPGAPQPGVRAVARDWQSAGLQAASARGAAAAHLGAPRHRCGWPVVVLPPGAAPPAGAPAAGGRPLPRGAPAPNAESGGGSWRWVRCGGCARSVAKGDLDLGRVGGIDGHDARHDARRRWHRLERGAQQAGAFGGVVVGRCTFVVHM